MTNQPFGAFVELEHRPTIVSPAPAFQKSANGLSIAPSSQDLDQMTWGQQYTGPGTDAATLTTPDDLEGSFPSTPTAHEAVEIVQTWRQPYMNRFRYLSACLIIFANGLNDSAPGALIPYMEKRYKIGYAIVSMIFITNAIGFISAALVANVLHSRLGRAKTLAVAQAFLLCGYIPIVCKPPFAVVVLSFLLLGVGLALNVALLNTFCANLANPTQVLGGFHGSYGIGGILGPLIATALVVRGYAWSTFYFLSLGLTVFNFFFATWSFWDMENEAPAQLLSSLERTATRRVATESAGGKKGSLLKQVLKSKVTILGAVFIFAYQGAEVSISGWVISFLITYRKGDPTRVGYVTAGFWAGITLGRFGLAYPAQRIGEKTAIFILTISAAVFELLVWFVPSVVGNAVAVSIVGLMLGPVYPCATTILAQLIPRKLHITSLSFVSALGSSGGALAPFSTGLLAQAVGTYVLHPICIGLFGVMCLALLMLPNIDKKKA
ncbi:MAG: hypothetical protein M1814_000643 [Vezdaea aestivalis]|nr:MAG: hypothetical protein M1814_000643 [Vezdaea aestivalis]